MMKTELRRDLVLLDFAYFIDSEDQNPAVLDVFVTVGEKGDSDPPAGMAAVYIGSAGGGGDECNAAELPCGRLQGVIINPDTTPLAIMTVSADGKIFKSTDLGKHWDKVADEPAESYAGVACRNGVYVAAGRRGTIAILKTSEDGGDTWEEKLAADAGGSTFLRVKCLNGKFIAVGSRGLIYTSDDNGRSWERRMSGVAADIFDIATSCDGKYIAVGTQQRNHIYLSSSDGIAWNAEMFT